MFLSPECRHVYDKCNKQYSRRCRSYKKGVTGPTGPISTITGPTGPASDLTGSTGPTGPISTVSGSTGATGPTGPISTVVGPTGPVSTVFGPTGASGATVGLLSADFYALMPTDNTATVAAGGNVIFPQIGASTAGSNIVSVTNSDFQLALIGVYKVEFQVSVTEPGQLEINLNGTTLTSSIVGRATGTSQIVGVQNIDTTTVNTILQIRNPAANSTALTLTPIAGGNVPVSAHLVITYLGPSNPAPTVPP